MGCDGSGCCVDSPMKINIQFCCSVFQHVQSPSTLNMLIFMTFYYFIFLKVGIQAPASIQNILTCIPSLRHILGLLSSTKLRSRCNMIHLMPLLTIMPWQPPRLFTTMINNSTLRLEMSVFYNPAISHPQPNT